MPIPTYAEVCPAVRDWAVARNLIHPDGTANHATPEAQYRKTLEEIEEARELLREWSHCLAFGDDACPDNKAEVKHALALEFGDILVTLELQSAMQGCTLIEALSLAGHIASPVATWQFIDIHAAGLGKCLTEGSAQVLAYIGAIATCVQDEARVQLCLKGPECMALALRKIQGRQGAIVDGAFVKAG